MIEQSPRRRHDEIDSRAQRLCLPLRADAAVHRDARERRAVRKPIEVFVDLSGELAGRREHQDARSRGDRVGAAVCSGEQSLHDRQEERGGLARSGLRAGDEIRSREDQRKDGTLDRRRPNEAAIGQRTVEAPIEIEGREVNRRRIVGCRFNNRHRP